MNRRELLTVALLGPALPRLESTPVAEPVTRERPWAARANELEPICHWPEIAAFDEWLDEQGKKHWADWSALDAPSRTALFLIMCDLADGAKA